MGVVNTSDDVSPDTPAADETCLEYGS